MRHELLSRFFSSLALVSSIALAGCGGSSSSVGGGTADGGLDGTWTMHWLSRTGQGGDATLTFTQVGDRVSGSVRFNGSPCFAGGQFDGTLQGSDLAGAVTAGGIRVEIQASVTASSLDGSYDAVNAGACTGDTGTFSATR